EPVARGGPQVRGRRHRSGGHARPADQGAADARDEARSRAGTQAREHPAVSEFELPEGLPPEEERAIIAALERYFDERDPRPNPWAMAGRIEAARDGVLQ